jgi:hypothetical protein
MDGGLWLACDCANIHGCVMEDKGFSDLKIEWPAAVERVEGSLRCILCGALVLAVAAENTTCVHPKAVRSATFMSDITADASYSHTFRLLMSTVRAVCASPAPIGSTFDDDAFKLRAEDRLQAEYSQLEQRVRDFELGQQRQYAQLEEQVRADLALLIAAHSQGRDTNSGDTRNNAATPLPDETHAVSQGDGGSAWGTPMRSQSLCSGASESDDIFEFEEAISLHARASNKWDEGDDLPDSQDKPSVMEAGQLSTSAPIDIPAMLQRPRAATTPREEDETIVGSINELSLSRTLKDVVEMRETGSPA